MTASEIQELSSRENTLYRKARYDLAYLGLMISARRLSRELRAGYDPNQPRDDWGKWTDGGSDANAEPTGEWIYQRIDLLEEERAGGHTVSKHVGKTPEVLAGYVRDSISLDPDPARHDIRSGSFSSLEAAERLTRSTIAANSNIVAGIVAGILPEQRVDAYFDSVTGMEAYSRTVRSSPVIRVTYGVGVYVRRDPARPKGYRIITAYPRNR